jgi:hypothetical protein
LQTNTAIDAGGKINPVPIGAFNVFTGTGMNASNGTSIYAIGYAFASFSDDSVWHSVSSPSSFVKKINLFYRLTILGAIALFSNAKG